MQRHVRACLSAKPFHLPSHLPTPTTGLVAGYQASATGKAKPLTVSGRLALLYG